LHDAIPSRGSVAGLAVHRDEVVVGRLVGEDVGELSDDRLSGSTAEDPVVVLLGRPTLLDTDDIAIIA
jgi:hypothetical protein